MIGSCQSEAFSIPTSTRASLASARGVSAIALVAFLVLLVASGARAGTTWDGGGAADTNVTTGLNWNDDSAPPFNSSDSLFFATGTSRLATINSSIDIGQLIYGSSQPFVIGSSGGSTLTLQGVSNGGVNTGITAAYPWLAGSGTYTLSAPVILGADQSWNASNGSGTTTLLVSGPISGAGRSLTKLGTGVLALSGSNTYSGATTISAGAVELRTGGSLAGPVAIGSGATLRFANGPLSSTLFANALSGSGDVAVAGGGSVSLLNAANSYSGVTTITDGELAIRSGAVLGNTSRIVVAGANSSLGNPNLGGQLALVSGSGLTLSAGITLSGQGNVLPRFSNDPPAGSLRSVGSNRLDGVIEAVPSAGATTINTSIVSAYGTLRLAGGISGTAPGVVQLNPGFTTSMTSGNFNGHPSGGNIVVSGSINLASGTLQIGQRLAQKHADGAQPSSPLGFGTVRLVSPSSGSSSIRVVDVYGFGSTLEIARPADIGGAVLQAGFGTIQIRSAAADLAGWGDTVVTGTTYSFEPLAKAISIYADNARGGSELNGTINLKLGAFGAVGELTASGGHGYGLSLTGTSAGGTIRPPTGNFSALTFRNSSNGLMTVASPVLTRSGTFAGAGDILFSGSFADTGATNTLAIGSSGRVEFTNTSSSLAATNLGAGTLRIAGFGALGSGTINIGSAATTAALEYAGPLASGTETVSHTLNLAGTTGGATLLANQAGLASLLFTGPITATGSGAKTFILGGSSAGDNTIASTIPNATGSTVVSLQKTGVGTWVLSATNGYTGATTVSGGTLKIQAGAGNIVQDTSGITFATDTFTNNAAGTLLYSGSNDFASSETVAALTPTAGAARIIASRSGTGSATLTFGSLGTRSSGATVEFNPGTSGTIAFTTAPTAVNGIIGPWASVSGTTWAALSGNNVAGLSTFTQEVAALGSTITSNTASNVRIDSAGSGDNIALSQATGTINTLLQSTTNAATVSLGSGTTLRVGGVMIASGQGALTIGSSAGVGQLTTSATGAGDLVLWNHSGSLLTVNSVIANIASGTSGLTKSGTGVVVLAGANTFTGNTTINDGTLRLSSGAVLSGTLANMRTTIRQAGVLDLNGVNMSGTAGILDGSGRITSSAASGTATLTIGAGNGANGYFTGVIENGSSGGLVGLTKTGTGTQFLSGANTYTGPTRIEGGTLAVTTLANSGSDSGIGRGAGVNPSAAANAASLVFNGGVLQYTGANGTVFQATQTPSVSIDRLFTLAGDGGIDSSGRYGTNNAAAGGVNNASLVFSNTAAVGLTGGPGSRTLTLTGSATSGLGIDNRFAPRLADGDGITLAVTKTGNTLWRLTGTSNTYTGATTVSAGILAVGDDSAAAARTLSQGSNLVLSGGVLQSTGTFTRGVGTGPGQVQLTAANAGFAADFSDLVVSLGSSAGQPGGQQLTWGAGGFSPGSQLNLGSAAAHGRVTLTNPIDLNGAVRTIFMTNSPLSTFDDAVLSGVISGTGGLTKTGDKTSTNSSGGAPSLYLMGANTFTGTTTIQNGPLVVEWIGRQTDEVSNFGKGTNEVRLAASVNDFNDTNANSLNYIGPGETTDRPIRIANRALMDTMIRNDGSGPLILQNLAVTGTGGNTVVRLGGSYGGSNRVTSNLAVTSGTIQLIIDANSNWTLSGSNTIASVWVGSGGVFGIGSDTAIGANTTIDLSPIGVYKMGLIAAVDGPRTIASNLAISSDAPVGVTGENSLTLTGTLSSKDSRMAFLSNQIVGGTFTAAGPINITSGFSLAVQGPGQTVLSGSLTNSGGITYTVSAAEARTGMLTLSGNYAGNATSSVNNGVGVLMFSSSAAIPGTGAIVTGVAGSTLAAGYAVDQAFLTRVSSTTASFAVGLGADSSNNLNFSSAGRNLTAASLGAVGPDTRIYSGTLTPNATAGGYRLGGGGGTLDFQSPLTGASNTLTVGGDLAGLGGTVILSSATNSYGGATTVQRGILQISSLTNAGSNSSTGTNASITLSSGTSVGTLRYVGSGHASNRTISIAGTVGGTLDASGSGALDMTSGTISAAAGTTVWLTGSSTANNVIGFISSGSNVIKTGPGRWQLSGASTYNGQLQVLDGTIVVGSTVDLFSEGNGPFGASAVPIVGDSTAGITGTAAMLAIGGIQVKRGLSIATLGPGSAQVTVLGITGTGTASFEGSKQIRVGRDLTLQASNGGTVSFENVWTGTSGTSGPGPAVVFTVGSDGNAGTVRFGSNLPSTLTGFNIVNGTAEMIGLINLATPVTVGSTLGAATLDLNGLPQTLSRLTFAGNSGSVTTGAVPGGTLQLASSGSVAVSGTGHVISSLVDLVDATTFNTDAAAMLTVSNMISSTGGAMGLTKTGLGALTLSAANTFSGDTTVSAGTLLLGHAQALTASTFTGGAGSLSFGGLTAATFGGLAGGSNLAISNTAAGAVALTVGGNNQSTTYSGVLSGAGGLTKVGTGVFTLAGNNTYSGSTSIAAGRLAVNGSLASAVTVQALATLGGSGRLAGTLTGDGLIAPGNSPGILTVDGQITPTASTSFAFEFSGTAPTWSHASASINDVLRLTNVNPFTSGLGSGNIVNVYFDVTSLANGDTFLGGFFTDRTSGELNFMAELGSPAYQFYVLGNGSGTATSYNGKSYYTLAQYNPSLTGATVSAVTVPTANYASGDVTNGQVTQFVIIPEPTSLALAAIGIAAAAWARRRRQRRADCQSAPTSLDTRRPL